MSADTPVISGWSAVSPYGLGAEPFSDGLRAGLSGIRTLNGQDQAHPIDQAGIVPDFEVSTVLGAKGTRSMDRVTGLAVTTAGMVLDAFGPGLTEAPETIGLVLGTGSGSVQSIMNFTRDSLTGDKPFHVDPARFPTSLMNGAAGRSAIWHGLKGPNSTIAGGALTGLLALSYAARLRRCGHSDVLLCGAAEELSPQRGWLEWHARPGESRAAPLGEGCAMFILESAARAGDHGRTPLATILGSQFGAFGLGDGAGQALGTVIRALLNRTGIDPSEVSVVAPADPVGILGDQERDALADVLGETPARVPCRRLLGDTAAASAAFQLAAVLATATDRPELTGGIALVTSVDRDGTVGCTLLRLHDRGDRSP